MRKLMWFTIGFGAACGICAWLWEIGWLAWIAGGVAALSGCLMIPGRRVPAFRRISALLLGAAAGLLWFQGYSSYYLSHANALDGQIVEVTACCSDYGYATEYGTAVDTVVDLEGNVYLTRLYFNGEISFEPGDYIRGTFRFQVTTPGGAENATHHQGKGIFLLGFQSDDAQLAKGEELPWYLYPAVLRRQLISIINDCFPEDAASFARALLLGERSGISYETNTSFKITGIMHIIAVSGLHVSILFGFVHTICFRRRVPTAILGIFSLILFAAAAGFTPSVTRACIMQILMLIAMLFDREYDAPTELAFSALAMMLVNPLVITSVSFQLSVGCMAGIFVFHEKIHSWITAKLGCGKDQRFVRIKRWFSGSVSVTLSAMTLTTPLVAHYFGTVSLTGVLTNLLTLWAVNFIFYGIILVCIAGSVLPAAGALLAHLVTWLIRYVLIVAGVLSKFPLAAVYTRSIYIVFWLIFIYVLMAVFLFSRNRRTGMLICCGVIGLCFALAASWIEPLTDGCRMTVLDVGQGQSIILQSEGKTYLVDCGGSYDEDAADAAAETLMSQGIFRLDGIILTHYDRDHSGGLPYLLTRIPADALLMPDASDEKGIGAQLASMIDGSVIYVSDTLALTYGDTELTVFGPAVTNSGNESSLAVLFQAEKCDILITGDRSEFGERMLMRQTGLPRLEVLVAGHHGAKSSTSMELLEVTKPAIVAISVGENYYGHPSQELLARLAAYGCLVYRTDYDGNLIFRR